MSEQLYGAESLRVSNALANLGIIAKETGNYAMAESRYRRALAIKEKHLGSQHPDLIALVESLAILYRDRAEYAQAEEMFQRTISLTAGSLGPEHPFVARHLANLSQLYWAAGQWEKAFSARQQVVAIEERNLPLELSAGSERQKLAFFEPLFEDLEETITFHVQQPSERRWCARPRAHDAAAAQRQNLRRARRQRRGLPGPRDIRRPGGAGSARAGHLRARHSGAQRVDERSPLPIVSGRSVA